MAALRHGHKILIEKYDFRTVYEQKPDGALVRYDGPLGAR